jgi:signal transduction histidine kinase
VTAQAVALAGWVAAAAAIVVAAVASRALRERAQEAARACHELRGPLTAARLGLQLGVRTGELSPSRLRAIDQELGRAALALEDLGGAPPRDLRSLERIDLRELLADSVEAWRAFAGARGVELTWRWLGGRAHAWGERLRLAQATGNLIANAIEHGGGTVEVRGRAANGTARIEVLDDGRGLPAPVAELAGRRGRGPRGHGLAIVTAIAAAHGGRIAAAPSEQGARVVLELPAATTAQTPAAG